jgi:carboxylesterase type B
MMRSLLSFATAAALLADGVVSQQAPTVKVKNGTLEGRYEAGYDQDLFLGIPFAQPPVGQLRFQNPQSLNETFDTLEVKKYGDSCVGYGVSDRR